MSKKQEDLVAGERAKVAQLQAQKDQLEKSNNDFQALMKRMQAGSMSNVGKNLVPPTPPKAPLAATEKSEARGMADTMGMTKTSVGQPSARLNDTRGSASPADRRRLYKEAARAVEAIEREDKQAELNKAHQDLQKTEQFLARRSASRGKSTGMGDTQGFS